VKWGDSGGLCMYLNRLLSAATAHVRTPGVLAIMMDTPFLKGSVFKESIVRMMWDREEREGTNCMQLLMRCMLASNSWPVNTVNLLHWRNLKNAVMVDTLKLSWSDSEAWDAALSMCLSTLHVMGSFEFHSHLPIYLLIPCMTLCRSGNLHAENGRLASTCADRKCVMYDLIVLG